jgi:hypothetical protein
MLLATVFPVFQRKKSDISTNGDGRERTERMIDRAAFRRLSPRFRLLKLIVLVNIR